MNQGGVAGDLLVKQPTNFELYINRRTANALDLTITRWRLMSKTKLIE